MDREPRSLHGFLKYLGLIAACAAVLSAESPEPVNEYQVKAAFVYNFARFVTWPEHAFKNTSDPISICVLGEDQFHGALERAIAGKTVEGRPFKVRHLNAVESGCNCHILFVSRSGLERFRAISEELKSSSVLTVGESPGFATNGGVINFKPNRGMIRFEININTAEEERLHISSKLLSLSEIVK